MIYLLFGIFYVLKFEFIILVNMRKMSLYSKHNQNLGYYQTFAL
jgi:hypothetical protein